MVKILSVVGTRPNFIKIAPLIKEIIRHKKINCLLVHTGQHYDETMSKTFFDDLEIPKPNINLGIGSASDVTQSAKIMLELEKVFNREKPDLVVVVGDVNSTFSAAITAKKCGIRVAHVEAGLRSFDMAMPEEINRILTDHISDFLFTTEQSANKNLGNENIDNNKIFFVGNVMVDTLLSHKKKSRKSNILGELKIKKNSYCVLTLHRPSNVDDKKSLNYILDILNFIQQKIKIIFPVHPRTLKNLKNFGMLNSIQKQNNITMVEPLGYLDFLCLMNNARLVVTDSGGIQEETTILRVPCITLRNNTERPITVEQGTNVVVSTDKKEIINAALKIINGCKINSKVPRLWDGNASKRIVSILISKLK